jgi:putative flippase GtrA
MIDRALGFKLGRFGVVGILATVIYVVVATIGNRWTALPPVLVSTIAYCCSGAWSYVGHYHITFRAGTAHRTSIAKFIVLFCSGYAVSSGIVLLGEALGLLRDFATAAAAVVLPIMNFVIMQLWVFAGRPAGASYAAERERDLRE